MRCQQFGQVSHGSAWHELSKLVKPSRPSQLKTEYNIIQELQTTFRPTKVLNFAEAQVWLMPVAEGTLQNLYPADEHKLTPQDFSYLAYELCCQLQQAHTRGIAHNDVAMGNVFICNQQLYLEDWGEATRVATHKPALGNIYRRAPELYNLQIWQQCTPKNRCKVDIWMLGILLLEMSGFSPFASVRESLLISQGYTILQAFTQSLQGTFRASEEFSRLEDDWQFFIRRVQCTLGKELFALTCQMLQLHPQDRPSAAEIIQMIGPFAAAPKTFPWNNLKPGQEIKNRENLLRLSQT